MKQLILGGARSGKSALAERLALQMGKAVIYIATANVGSNDSEMDSRIHHHQRRRPVDWPTVEAPVQLAEQLRQQAAPDRCLLVDCLTLWLSNCLLGGGDDSSDCWRQQRWALFDTLATLPGDIIFVSNEVGCGIVPLGEVNRRFVDESGFLHQHLGVVCDRVIFTAAGLPLIMKGGPLTDNEETRVQESKGKQ